MASKPPVIAPKKLSGGTLNMRFMNKTKTVPPKAESIAITTTTPRKIHTTFEIATNTECYGKEVIDVIGRRSFQGFNPKVEEVVMAGWNQCKSDKRMRADIGDEEMLERYKTFVGVQNVANNRPAGRNASSNVDGNSKRIKR